MTEFKEAIWFNFAIRGIKNKPQISDCIMVDKGFPTICSFYGHATSVKVVSCWK